MAPNRHALPALDARPGPAERISDDRAREMVDRAVASAFVPRARFLARPSAKVALVLAATLVVGVAGAATVGSWLRHTAPRSVTETRVLPEPTERVAPPVASAVPPPQATAREEPAPVTTPPAASARRESAPQARSAPTPAMPAAPAQDLLQQANELRAARRWREAAHAYERVLAVHPGSAEAYAAAVAAAELRLEQMSDPGGALRLYRAALQGSPQGVLTEQALWGVARCKRALGDRDGERIALRDYVSRYPGGLFAPSARQRLDEGE